MKIDDLSESKSKKSDVHYQSKPHAGQRCINCTMWRDPNKCSAVAGNISPDGWCDYWAPGAYGKHGKSIDESEILDEGWRENLYKLVAIGALSLTSAGAIGTAQSYERWAAAHPQAMRALDAATSVPNVEPTKIAKQAAPGVTKSKLAPSDSIRPLARPPELTQEPTSQQRPKAKPSLDTLGPMAKPLHNAAINAGITGTELIALMSQAAHETKMFSDLVEKGNQEYFKKYDPEFSPKLAKILGNTQAGDGFTYRGRGYLHLTGRYNYEKAGTALGYPLIDDPDLAADPAVAAEIAIWFWKNRVSPRVSDFTDIKAVTHPINPRYVGLDDRKEKYKYILNLVKQFDIKLDEDGRIVRGVNTTVDVDTDEIKVQSVKFGNTVTVGGEPPFLRTDGVAPEPKYTLREWAAMQGGHSIDETPPTPKLFDWLLNTDKDI